MRKLPKKRYVLLFLLLLFIAKLFISTSHQYEENIGSLALAVTDKSIFHYKVPAKGNLVFFLSFSNTATSFLNRTEQVHRDHYKEKDREIRNLCTRYSVDLSTAEGARKNYRCKGAFSAGMHQSKLYDEETDTLLSEMTHPNGAAGFKLLIINGIPRGRTVRLEVQTLSFDDPANELAISIAQAIDEPLPQINKKLSANVIARLRPYSKWPEGNIPESIRRLTQ